MSSNPNQSQKTLLDPTRVVYAWGDGEFGKLGIGQLTGTKTPVRLTTIRGDRVIGLSAGSHNSAFIGESGSVYIAGKGRTSSKGDSSVLGPDVVDEQLSHPKRLSFTFPHPIKQIQLGNYHALALSITGQVWSWGAAQNGQLGHGDAENQIVPKLIQSLRDVLLIAAGVQHSVALTYYGELYAWGSNDHGQLGLGNTNPYFVPTRVRKLHNVMYVACGSFHTLAVVRDSASSSGHASIARTTVWQWGQQNTQGKVCSQATEVAALRNHCVHRVAAGEWHNLALTQGGQVFQWTLGQTPTLVTALNGQNIRQICAGAHHSLALSDRGVVFSWGRNHAGQLGRETSSSSSAAATSTSSSQQALALSANSDASVPDLIPALLAIPSGSLSDSKSDITKTPSSTSLSSSSGSVAKAPVVPTRPSIRTIACGAYHSLALSESDPHRLAQMQLLKKERLYVLKLKILLEYYYEPLMKVAWAEKETTATSTTPSAQLSGDSGFPSTNSTSLLLSSRLRRSLSMSRREGFVQQTSDPRSQVREMFTHVAELYATHLDLLQNLDDFFDGLSVLSLPSLLLQHLHRFSVYVIYADNYNTAATNRQLLSQSYPQFNQLLKQKLDETNAIFQPHLGTPRAPRDFSLKALLIEPIKQIARYVNILRVITDTSPEKERHDYSLVLHRMSGLLERTCKNFNLLEPREVLTCTLDDFGHPHIGGGTVELLIERLTHHQFIDLEFSNAFLLTYRMFMTPLEFLRLLQARYASTAWPNAGATSTGVTPSSSSLTAAEHKLVQQQVIRVFKQWIESKFSSYDFEDTNSELVQAALQWVDDVLSKDDDHRRQAEQIRLRLKGSGSAKVIQLNTAHSLNNLTTVVPATLVSKKKGRASISRNSPRGESSSSSSGSVGTLAAVDLHTFFVTALEAELVATEIVLDDYSIYRRILPRELLSKSWNGTDIASKAPNLNALSTRFNHLSLWVVYEIVRPDTPKERATVFAHIVTIANELLNLHDFHSFFALVSGLNNSSVVRLKKTLSKLSDKTLETLQYFNKLVSGEGNYRDLRAMIENIEPPAIPCFALTLKDLTFIEDGNPDKLDGVGINFYKWRLEYDVIQDVLAFQQVSYPQTSDPNIKAYLQMHIANAVQLGEDGLYKQSKKLE